MDSKRWWIAAPLALGLVVAACNGDADATPAPDPTAAPATATAAPAPTPVVTDSPPAASEGTTTSVGILTLGDEEIPIDRLFCFFEEQPRAGLGGVFTHTAQGRATNAAGDEVVLDVSRARDEDGTVGDDILIDIGDPRSDEAVGYRAVGAEGLVEFGEASIKATDVEVNPFGSDSVIASFDVTCG